MRFEIGGEKMEIEKKMKMLKEEDGEVRKKEQEEMEKKFKENIRKFKIIKNKIEKEKEI